MANKVNINIPLPQIEIHLEGKWQKAISLGDGLKSSIQTGYNKGSLKFTRQLLSIVRTAIRSGTPPIGSGVAWKPLSESTIKKHGQHGIYHLTGLYLRSLGIHKEKNRTYIGIPRGIKPSNTRAKKTLNQIAIILEFGSKSGNIPSRPLWGPSYKSANKSGKLKKELMREIRSQIYKDHGINPKQIR